MRKVIIIITVVALIASIVGSAVSVYILTPSDSDPTLTTLSGE